MSPLAVSKRLVGGVPLHLILRCVRVKPVDRTTNTSQAVNNVADSDGLRVPVFDVDDAIANHGCQETFEHDSRFVVYTCGYTLHAAPARKSSDRGLGYIKISNACPNIKK